MVLSRLEFIFETNKEFTMRYLLALLLSLCLAVPALAGFSGPAATGGFAGPGPREINQAAQVQTAQDEMPCVLTGNIIEQIRHDKYTFQDASGTVVVEIENKVFGNNNVTPQTRVKLVGEVDRKRQRPNEVEIRYLEIVR